MILRDKPGKLELLFAVRGSIVPVIAPSVAFLMLMGAAVVAVHRYVFPFPQVDGFGFTIFGIALSLFLGFRNNAAYERWWEARKLWGGLLADARAFARELEIFVKDRAVRMELLGLALSFLHSHRGHLRGTASEEQPSGMFTPDLRGQSPCAVLNRAASTISRGYAAGEIDGFGARALSERLGSMSKQQAGCERIASTPLPYVYSLLIYRTAYLYCLLLPLALVESAGWMTPLFVGIVAYVFLGLAEVTEELSHPFGTTPNAVPLDAICRTAEISLAPHLNIPAPPPLEARNFFVS